MAEVAYLDASAIVKVVAVEDESAALRDWLGGRPALVSSELALTEVHRSIQRKASGRTSREQTGLRTNLERVFTRLDLVPLDRAVLRAAGALPGASLRALDAIHVVSALTLGEAVGAFVTYDERQAEAAETHRLAVVGPR